MPWSPIPKMPFIVNDLRKSGYREQVSLEYLKRSIMRETGLIRAEAIKRVIQAMEDLGYLKQDTSSAFWFVHQEKLYEFNDAVQEEAEVENLLNSHETKE